MYKQNKVVFLLSGGGGGAEYMIAVYNLVSQAACSNFSIYLSTKYKHVYYLMPFDVKNNWY